MQVAMQTLKKQSNNFRKLYRDNKPNGQLHVTQESDAGKIPNIYTTFQALNENKRHLTRIT